MRLQFFTLCLCLLFPVVCSADVLTVPTHMVLSSTNAVDSTVNPAYSAATAFDGILNSTTPNGAVFDLTGNNPSVWTVNFIGVQELESVLLHQLVGAEADNGIRNFSIDFFDGSDGAGTNQLSQNFLASLNSNSSPELFSLSSTVTTPGSMVMSVTSSHGNSALAEFSEVQFIGTAVPEPGSIAILAISGLACVSRRRRRS